MSAHLAISASNELPLAISASNELPEMQKFDVVQVKLWNIAGNDARNAELYVVPFICNPLTNQRISFAKEKYKHLIDLPLADCDDGKDKLDVDILIGADCHWNFVTKNMIRGMEGPVAIETMFGWVISGPMDEDVSSFVNIVTQHVMKVDVDLPAADERLFDQLNKFCRINDTNYRYKSCSLMMKEVATAK